ncbi:multidrug efflux RND transporter permease subunit [Candidimonas nitroreducens]|uniref:Efflux pump membrane transporter n=1 Tax=Candidimonas nitroreducens TaxID=683354 RepID=A0A225M1T8_9BURK|nr:multidrug efflux RND transporter permease subunit [Candidimonas nitroreducens]OWT54193.1 hydrophobe/amphiphile efflux-1 family RND transporter [Candidimonas nitroreducens]
MSNFFIDRPIFAWVIAILITLGGVLAIDNLGVQSYPNIAPPQVSIVAKYPGASASTAEGSVTEVIEQQLTGIDNLLYFSSSTASNGRVAITLTFKPGTDPDVAAVQTQNQVARAERLLPPAVLTQGIVVAKANPDTLMAIALRSSNPAIGRDRLNDIVASQVLNPISRISGVGTTRQFGAEYAMRIWLNPTKMHGYGISATDVINALDAQNIQVAAGSLGADPAVKGWGFTANVAGEGLFATPEQFLGIILRANSDGTVVKLGDIATADFGPQSYGFDTLYDGKPVGAFAIQTLPGANGLAVAKAVRAEMAKLSVGFPEGVTWSVPYDTTTFINISIHDVLTTLVEALILVFLVMLVFLQNFRATIIPAIVIPVALLGAFIGMDALGFTINQLSLFGMVMAIGIVVDDAIVVLENIERIMTEQGLSPKEAARQGMKEISGAVVAITAVLLAVFVPSALQSGSTGIIYRQFALTIAVSMFFSAFLALTFTPALCAKYLKPEHERKKNILFRKFNDFFGWTHNTYIGHISHAVRHAPRWMMVFALVVVMSGFLYVKLPGSFLPQEDQGYLLAMVQLPPGATKQRSEAVMDQVWNTLHKEPEIEHVMQIVGFSPVGSGENNGMAFIQLTDWDNRELSAHQLIPKLNALLHQKIRDASIVVVNLPTVHGLGQFGGFDMFLEDVGGLGRTALDQALATTQDKAKQDKVLVNVRANQLPPAPQLDFKIDRVQAASMGLSATDVANAASLMLAPTQIGQMFAEGRVKSVMLQAAAPYRMSRAAFSDFYTPSSTQKNADGTPAMIPISSVLKSQWDLVSPSLTRFNGNPAIEVVGDAAPGYTSGQAMDSMQKIVARDLPHGFGFDWAGESFQEVASSSGAPMLMALSILVVFLALAALYESWSVPVAVLLIVPLTLLGTVLFTMGRGLANDVYFKIGLVTVIGLAAKNAILIIEYAVAAQAEGKTLREAVLTAARLRFRPILMTSFAFILGVFPLFISTGAGANARHAIGTGVIGGMLFATIFGLLLIPVFYVIVRRIAGDKLDKAKAAAEKPPTQT